MDVKGLSSLRRRSRLTIRCAADRARTRTATAALTTGPAGIPADAPIAAHGQRSSPAVSSCCRAPSRTAAVMGSGPAPVSQPSPRRSGSPDRAPHPDCRQQVPTVADLGRGICACSGSSRRRCCGMAVAECCASDGSRAAGLRQLLLPRQGNCIAQCRVRGCHTVVYPKQVPCNSQRHILRDTVPKYLKRTELQQRYFTG